MPGGSAASPNDYWDHADYIVAAIQKRNMYLALLPCWGRAYVVPQFSGAHIEFNAEEASRYGAFLGARYKDQKNIIWVLGGDAKAQINAYDKNQKKKTWDKTHVFRAMAEGIAQGATGQKPAWNKDHPAWDRVFITYHTDGDALDNSSKWFHNDAWLDANGVEVWREIHQLHHTMLTDYQLEKPVKPSLFLEGSYEFGSYKHECGWVTPVKIRRQIYHTFFAGGAGHTYGAGPIWPMRGNQGDYSCGYTWQQAMQFPGGINFTGVVKTFLQQYHWATWVPDGRMITGWVGEGESLKTGVTAKGGTMALVYFSNNSHTRITNTLDKKAKAFWFDPRNGKEQPAGRFKKNEARDMVPPSRWEDAILILRTP